MVERRDVDDMARLMAALGDDAAPPFPVTRARVAPSPGVPPAGGIDPSVAAMKTILEAYNAGAGANVAPPPPRAARAQPVYESPSMVDIAGIIDRLESGAETVMDRVVQESGGGDEIREALLTQPIAEGVRIGDWEVHCRSEGKRRYYDVVRGGDPAPIASDLLLYEAAHGLARLLNMGQPINATPVTEIVLAEQEYAGALADAIHFTHLLRKSRDDGRAPVFEARLGLAKQKAVAARARVTRLTEGRARG